MTGSGGVPTDKSVDCTVSYTICYSCVGNERDWERFGLPARSRGGVDTKDTKRSWTSWGEHPNRGSFARMIDRITPLTSVGRTVGGMYAQFGLPSIVSDPAGGQVSRVLITFHQVSAKSHLRKVVHIRQRAASYPSKKLEEDHVQVINCSPRKEWIVSKDNLPIYYTCYSCVESESASIYRLIFAVESMVRDIRGRERIEANTDSFTRMCDHHITSLTSVIVVMCAQVSYPFMLADRQVSCVLITFRQVLTKSLLRKAVPIRTQAADYSSKHPERNHTEVINCEVCKQI